MLFVCFLLVGSLVRWFVVLTSGWFVLSELFIFDTVYIFNWPFLGEENFPLLSIYIFEFEK